MIALTFTYEGTVYIRRPTCGGMDSEPSHSEVQKQQLTVVVPDDSTESFEMARIFVMHYGGNKTDPAFKLAGTVENRVVNAILSTRTR